VTNSPGRRFLHGAFGVREPKQLAPLLPGTLLAIAVMLISLPLADWLGHRLLALQGLDPTGRTSPISSVSVAILVGMLLRNLAPLPSTIEPGVKFAMSKLLRLGIILVGIKLSALDVLKLGIWGIPVVVCAIAAGLLFVTWFNGVMKLPPRLGTLIAAGTSICGVTAIVSTAPAIEAEDREVAYAVANVALFGLFGMLVYPYLAPKLLATSEQIGLFLGTAIHDTSQVVGAALTYQQIHHDEIAFKAATVTKLTRNLFLAAVIPIVTYRYLRTRPGATQSTARKTDFGALFPMFILGFVGMAAVRTIGDATLAHGRAFGVFDADAWKRLTTQIGEVLGTRLALGTALAGVGLNTRFASFRGVGLKPFAVGFAGALVVGTTGFLLASWLGRFVKL
jgi:uncharacterized integral membrane protein (TIGR00698 family)